ncbi:hypothetical protein KKB40_04935 [Patescibacteria group bacterium]|nr:hypothetical protein [Patescibacteria group bacterium]
MLTKTDLGQISKVVNKTINASEERLSKEIEKVVKTSEKKLSVRIEKSEDRLGKKIARVDKKLDYTINFLDRDYLRLLERVERIENHLHLDSLSA